MSSPISFASYEAAYPPYAAEFDPYDRGYLLIGGGGGEGNTGVSNRITLLDTSTRASLSETASLTLPRDHDSVNALTSLTTPTGLRTLACQSAGRKARQAGENNPIKSFDVAFPSKTHAQQARLSDDDSKSVTEAEIKQVGEGRLLSQKAVTGKYAAQDPIRLSPVRRRDERTKRVGAVASKDADANEVCVFDATREPLDDACVLGRIPRELEVEDLAWWAGDEDGEFALAVCDAQGLFVQEFRYGFGRGSYEVADARERYRVPSQQRKLRRVRWIAKNHVLVLSDNTPSKSSELLVVKTDGMVTQRYPLPTSMKTCGALDIAPLDPDPSTGEYQIVIATGGRDGSILLLHTSYTPLESSHIAPIRKYNHLTAVHASNIISALAFSTFFPPTQPPTSTTSVAASHPRLKLASLAALSNTVVVESITLTSVPTSPRDAPTEKGDPGSPTVRWVLSSTAVEGMFSYLVWVVAAFGVVVSAVLFQRYRTLGSGDVMAPLRLMPLKDYAAMPVQREEVLGKAREMVDTDKMGGDEGVRRVREAVEMAEQSVPGDADAEAKVRSLAQLVEAHGGSGSGPGGDGEQSAGKIVLVSPYEEGANVAVHEKGHAALEGAKRFGELKEEQKVLWIQRLKDAGHWVESEGKSVLEGVFFSEVAVEVGGAIRDAVLN